MQGHSQPLISMHFGRSGDDKPSLPVADLRDGGVVDDVHTGRPRRDDSGKRFGAVRGNECDLHLQGVACIHGRQRQSRQRLLSLALPIEPKRPGCRNQAAHAPKQTQNVDPRRGQPFGKLHSSSPVLRDSCTVEGPGGGVIPLRSLAGASS